MNRLYVVGLLVPALLAATQSQTRERAAPGDGRSREATLGVEEFRAVLDSVAAGWNGGRPETAVLCFTEAAIYLEPPARQRHREWHTIW